VRSRSPVGCQNSVLPPNRTQIRVASDLASAFEPTKSTSIDRLPGSLPRAGDMNPEGRVDGRGTQAAKRAADRGAEVAGLPRGLAEEHDRRRGLPQLGHHRLAAERYPGTGEEQLPGGLQERPRPPQDRSTGDAAAPGARALQRGAQGAGDREHPAAGKRRSYVKYRASSVPASGP
jgi:hypothetical protein